MPRLPVRGLEHCHGSSSIIPYRRDECTEPDCVTPDAAHALTSTAPPSGALCDGRCLSAHRVG